MAHSGRSYRTTARAPVARSTKRQYDTRCILLAPFEKTSRNLLLVDHPRQPSLTLLAAHPLLSQLRPLRRDCARFLLFISFMARHLTFYNINLTRGALQITSCRPSTA